jgi:glycosyltransferase involved in cell wall biosynthesis
MSRTTSSDAALDVGLLCQGWFPDAGGVETHTRDLARELLARGHRVHVLCLDYSAGREPYATHVGQVEGVDVRRMSYLYHDHRALADVVENPRARDVVLAWLAETPCDVVHVQHPTGFGLSALRAIHDLGLALVMTLHDYWALCPRGQMLQPDGTLSEAPEPERCGRCLARTWPHLMPSGGGEPRGPGGAPAPSDAAAAAARTAYALECLRLPLRLFTPSAAACNVYARAGVPAERIEVCENGVDVAGLSARVAELRRARPRAAGELRLGVLGTVLPSKGALELARAFARARVPGLSLEIHGALPSYHGDASYVEELRALADSNPLLRLHGAYRLDELPAILAGLDGVAAPSRWVEVFGLTVREAAAAGLPVLVSDAGDLPAVARGGAAGLVVPSRDEDAWQRALVRFGTDPEARRAWSRPGPPPRSSGEMTEQLLAGYRAAIREAAAPVQRPRAPGFLRRLLGRG